MDYSNQKDKAISLSSNGRTKQFFVENIVYIISKEKQTIVYLNDNSQDFINNRLIELEEKLNQYDFFRINRNTIVNLRYFMVIDNSKTRCFYIRQGKNMKVSRRKWCNFKQKVEK